MFTEVFETDFDRHIRSPGASLLQVMWKVARGDRRFPQETELVPTRLKHLADDLMLLRVLAGGDWLYEHYGKGIVRSAGFDMTSKRVSDFQGVLRDFYVRLYRRITQDGIPLASLHQLGAFGETPLWERVMLPLGTDDRVSAIIVFNKAREISTDISSLNTRAKGRALVVLQFIRRTDGSEPYAIITGANHRARVISGYRLDEMMNRAFLDLFPDVARTGIWDACIDVAATRQTRRLIAPYSGAHGRVRLRIEITPYGDGVTIDFEHADEDIEVAQREAERRRSVA